MLFDAKNYKAFFAERLSNADYAARFLKARERAKQMTIERGFLPAHGLVIDRYLPNSQASKACFEAGDILQSIDGKLYIDDDDIRKYRIGRSEERRVGKESR